MKAFTSEIIYNDGNLERVTTCIKIYKHMGTLTDWICNRDMKNPTTNISKERLSILENSYVKELLRILDTVSHFKEIDYKSKIKEIITPVYEYLLKVLRKLNYELSTMCEKSRDAYFYHNDITNFIVQKQNNIFGIYSKIESDYNDSRSSLYDSSQLIYDAFLILYIPILDKLDIKERGGEIFLTFIAKIRDLCIYILNNSELDIKEKGV